MRKALKANVSWFFQGLCGIALNAGSADVSQPWTWAAPQLQIGTQNGPLNGKEYTQTNDFSESWMRKKLLDPTSIKSFQFQSIWSVLNAQNGYDYESSQNSDKGRPMSVWDTTIHGGDDLQLLIVGFWQNW